MAKHFERSVSFSSQELPQWMASSYTRALRPWRRASALAAQFYRRRYWSREVLSLLLSTVTICSVCVVLKFNDGQSVSAWSGPVTLNAIVSVLVTTLYLFLMKAISSSISQLKWLHFHSSQCLRDFERYDSASRGIATFDALWILWNRKHGLLTPMSILLGLLVLAIGPLSQQILQLAELHITVEGLATLPVAINSTYHTTSNFDLGMISAISSGIFSTDTTDFRVKASCGNGNCTWDQYPTLSFQTQCVDVSSQLVYASPEAITQASNNISTTMNSGTQGNSNSYFVGLPGGINIDLFDVQQFYLSVINGSASDSYVLGIENQESYKIFTFDMMRSQALSFNSTSLLTSGVTKNIEFIGQKVQILYFWLNITTGSFGTDENCEPGEVENCPQEIRNTTRAWECTTSPVLQSLKSSFTNGNFSETPSTSAPTYNVTLQDDPACRICSKNVVFDNDRGQQFICGLDILSNTYQHTAQLLNGTSSRNDVRTWDTLNATGDVAGRIHRIVAQETGEGNMYGVGYEGSTLSSVDWMMNNMALSMTQFLREAESTLVHGTNYTTRVVFDIRWEWLTIPVVLVVGTAVLVALTALETRRRGIPVWTESSLATMVHGVDGLPRLDLARLLDAENLEQASSDISVQLEGRYLNLEIAARKDTAT